jgi:hypothetical protein
MMKSIIRRISPNRSNRELIRTCRKAHIISYRHNCGEYNSRYCNFVVEVLFELSICIGRIFRSGKYLAIMLSIQVLKFGYFCTSLYQFTDILGPLYIVMRNPSRYALAQAALPSNKPFSPQSTLIDFAASSMNDKISSLVCLVTPCNCNVFFKYRRTLMYMSPVNGL